MKEEGRERRGGRERNGKGGEGERERERYHVLI